VSYIKIIRLKNGDDIISFVETKEKNIKLIHPLIFAIVTNKKTKQYELVLTNWLPKTILEKNEADISKSDILTILEPNESFKEYYLNFLASFGGDEIEEDSDEEVIKDLIESLDAKNSKQLH
jgi:hypothetical protein